MNILDVFKNKVGSLLKESDQEANESLIELATFFYKIDNRVSLEEQRYVDELMGSIEWSSTISIESFQRSCVSKINQIIRCSEEETLSYLSNLMKELSQCGAVDKAQVIAKEISDSDGEIADDEVKYLDLVMSFE
ncbi:hypothetical protein ACMXYV_06605 [Neptuniibacter sp. SY11_33]|uniref:hypothetical protein n=1 Tax=Neptuniibacter sp. SY11_33 TaxID=3398215 RepID=UPI0039F4F1D1